MFRFRSRLALLVLPTLAAALAGCAEHGIAPSGAHAITPPEAVQLYQKEPWKYELIGHIALPVTPDMKWDENGDSTLGFDALKAKASAMGANGILLMQKHGGFDLSVGAGYK